MQKFPLRTADAPKDAPWIVTIPVGELGAGKKEVSKTEFDAALKALDITQKETCEISNKEP